MLLTLERDQELFHATTVKLLNELVPVEELRRRRDDPQGFGDDYWRRGAELGWTSLLVSEAHGGGSIGHDGLIDLAIVAYEFGRHAAPGPLVVVNVVAATLSEVGGPEHEGVIDAIVSGTSIATWCLNEPRPNERIGQRCLRHPRRGRRGSAQRRQAPGRVGRPGRPPAGHRSHRDRPHPGAGSRRYAWPVGQRPCTRST